MALFVKKRKSDGLQPEVVSMPVVEEKLDGVLEAPKPPVLSPEEQRLVELAQSVLGVYSQYGLSVEGKLLADVLLAVLDELRRIRIVLEAEAAK